MAERVVERTETETPRETVVIHDKDSGRVDRAGNNNGVIIAVIILAIILLLVLLGGGLFGSSGAKTPSNTNIQAPTTSTKP